MDNTNIKAIDALSIHHLTSGQVITDLQSAIKELVENSLDSGATSIEVRLKENGTQSIEVIDNGSGIRPEDHAAVGLKHHTSKLSSYDDLTTVTSFGFRGEALSALCATCESVVITTATEAPLGTALELDKDGTLKRSKKAARNRGTTVVATGLFNTLPVRQKELIRNKTREYTKALHLLTAYALIPCTKENQGVRLTVTNQVGKSQRSPPQIKTDGSTSLEASVKSLWGPKAAQNLSPLDLKLSIAFDKPVLKRLMVAERTVDIKVKGLISKFAFGCGRATSDRQFIFVNGRPCNAQKVQKGINETYRSFNATQTPIIIADFQIPTDCCDINVSPDKRSILIHSEDKLVDALKASLEKTFENERSSFPISTMTKANLSTQSEKVEDRVDKLEEDDDEPVEVFDVDPQPFHGVNSSALQPGLASGGSMPTASSSPPKVYQHFIKRRDVRRPSDPILSSSSTTAVASSRTLLSSPTPVVLEGGSDSASEEDDIKVLPTPVSARNGLTDKDLHQRPVQAILSTKNASWNMRKGTAVDEDDEGDGGPESQPKKRRRIEQQPAESLRSQLAGFVRTGSQINPIPIDTDDEEEEPDRHGHDRQEAPRASTASQSSNDMEVPLGIQTLNDLPTSQSTESVLDKFSSQVNTSENGLFSNSRVTLPTSTLDVTTVPENVSVAEGVAVETVEGSLRDANSPPSHVTTEETIQLGRSLLLNGDAALSTSTSFVDSLGASQASSVEVLQTKVGDDVRLHFSMDRVLTAWQNMSSTNSIVPSIDDSTPATPAVKTPANFANTSDAASAEQELARVIEKGDFSSMEVLGQFNLGFIIARLRRPASELSPAMDDLFIIDQHASDEKYNFETLQQTTKIESQKLYQPRPLDLGAAEELVAIDNLDVLRSNGFDVSFDPDAPSGQHEKLMLVAQPVSKGTVFDMTDLEELLHLMRDQPAGKMVRCSKVRAMFASRACRKSVMIGKHLTSQKMTTLVRHMAMIDQPWNCPHGRPTMRHLLNLDGVKTSVRQSGRTIDWKTFQSAAIVI